MNIPKIHHTSHPRKTYTIRLSTYNQQQKYIIDSLLEIEAFWYNRSYRKYENNLIFFIKTPLNGHGFQESTLKPKHLNNYTKIAIKTMGFSPRDIGETYVKSRL